MTELTSWTRTLNVDDALELLEDAQPGELVADWAKRAHDILPQAGSKRRGETIRMVRRSLLDITDSDGEARVADSRYLKLIREGSARLRLDLLHGRFLYGDWKAGPWIERALTELVHPALEASEVPLAPEDADLIDNDTWEDFVSRHLKPGAGKSSISKTRSQIITNLSNLGVVHIDNTHVRVHRAEPARLAFGWLVAYELRERNLGEMALHIGAEGSRAAQLFAPTPVYAEQCLVEAIDAGILKEGHLVGQVRIYVGAL